MGDAPKLVFSDDQHALWTWRNLLIQAAFTGTTPSGVAVLRDHVESLCAARPDGVAVVTLVPAGCPIPSPTTRAAISSLLRRMGELPIRGFGLVLAGSGFWAAAARGASAGMLMAARSSCASKLFATADEAAPWLEVQAGRAGAWSADDLARAWSPCLEVLARPVTS